MTEARSEPGPTPALAADLSLAASAGSEAGSAGVRLSRSALWRRQRRYYQEAGREAWFTDAVPSRVSTSPALAQAFARVVARALEDAGPGTAPAPILELGGGAGRFAWLMLRKLEDALGGLERVRYLLTDAAPANVEAWRADPALASYAAPGGPLAFAPLAAADLAADPTVEAFLADAAGGPAIFAASYLFDSIEADLFRVGPDGLEEGLVALAPETGEAGDAGREAGAAVAFRAAGRDYYGDADLDAVLEQHRELSPGRIFLFPTAAIAAVAGGLAAAGRAGRASLWLMADRGYHDMRSLDDVLSPTATAHGSVSLSVNFAAIRRYVLRRGGRYRPHGANRSTFGVALGGFGIDGGPWRGLAAAMDDALGGVNPEDAAVVADGASAPEADSAAALAALERSGFDPLAAIPLGGKLRALAGVADEEARRRLRAALDETWRLRFGLPQERGLAFVLGSVAQALGDRPRAERFYRRSLETAGEDAPTRFNLGVCAAAAGDSAAARGHFRRALALEPGLEAARAQLSRLDDPVA